MPCTTTPRGSSRSERWPWQSTKRINAVTAIRDLLGPTDSTVAPAGTIRGDMGTTSMKNICHASDSTENAAIEVERFFNPGEVH